MTAPFLPFGQLVSFAGLVFTGAGALNDANAAWLAQYDASYQTALTPVYGQPYPMDGGALAPAPLKDPTVTYTVLLYADDGDAHPYQTLEAQWNAIAATLAGTHSYRGATAASGQVGDLVVSDASGAHWAARARMLKPAPFKIQPGDVAALSIDLPFVLLEPFAAAS